MRALVLTPQMGGLDGVSEMSRQVVAALEAQVGLTLSSLDVWSLTDATAPSTLGRVARFRTARGSRIAFASFGVRFGAARDTLAVVLHAHLLPVTLPLIRLGARVVPVLLGIEVWKPLGRLERAALRRAWRVAAISQHTSDRFRAANPELAGIPVRVCHPGLGGWPEVPRLRGSEVPTFQGSRELRNPGAPEPRNPGTAGTKRQDPPFALIVGRMSSAERYKGHDELIDIWPRVRAAVPGATLVVTGGGDDRPRLAAKAESLGVAREIRFEGVVPAERLGDLYRDAALFVMPSPNEGFGLVFVEAMRAGTPCIAATGAAEEIVEDGVTGLIVPPGDRDALAGAVIDLLSNPARRAAMGRRAADVARTRFGAEAFANRLNALLDLAGTPAVALMATDAAC